MRLKWSWPTCVFGLTFVNRAIVLTDFILCIYIPHWALSGCLYNYVYIFVQTQTQTPSRFVECFLIIFCYVQIVVMCTHWTNIYELMGFDKLPDPCVRGCRVGTLSSETKWTACSWIHSLPNPDTLILHSYRSASTAKIYCNLTVLNNRQFAMII